MNNAAGRLWGPPRPLGRRGTHHWLACEFPCLSMKGLGSVIICCRSVITCLRLVITYVPVSPHPCQRSLKDCSPVLAMKPGEPGS